MKLEAFMACVRRGEIPPEAPDFAHDDTLGSSLRMPHADLWMDYIRAKTEANNHGMWALVDLTWTKRLAEWIGDRHVLEVMSGRGWLAAALQHHGVLVHPTDPRTSHPWKTGLPPLVPVASSDAVSAIHGAVADMLLMSWPPYQDPIAMRVLEAWNDRGPLVYVGEWDGCNGDENFNQSVKLTELDVGYRMWPSLHDRVWLARLARRE